MSSNKLFSFCLAFLVGLIPSLSLKRVGNFILNIGEVMYASKLLTLLVGPIVAGIVSATKIRFAPGRGNRSYHPQFREVPMFFMMKKVVASIVGLNLAGVWSAAKMQSMLLALILSVFVLSMGPASAAEKKMVKDPTTGQMVTAPEYGGTVNLPQQDWWSDQWDAYYAYVRHSAGVLEHLGMRNWGIDRDEFDFQGVTPVSALTGMLAESWSQPDPLTYVFKIRQGVYWHKKAPMRGRELTADDIVYNYQRLAGLGKFSDAEPSPMREWATLPFESITATDKWTVVFKLTEPNLSMLETLLDDYMAQIYPPEVIEETRTAEAPVGKLVDVMDWSAPGPMS